MKSEGLLRMMNTNARIKTPIGEGISQGLYAIRDGQGEIVRQAVLVRLPVNDQTRGHLSEPNCLTPRANRSALFVFPTSENGFIRKELAQCLNWVIAVLIILFCVLRGWLW
jgi:hypothetical protein